MTATSPQSKADMLYTLRQVQVASGQQTVRFHVLLAGAGNNISRQRRRGRPLVPANLFKVITYVLLVVRILRAPGPIFFCRPEAGRIGRKHFVSQYQSARG